MGTIIHQPAGQVMAGHAVGILLLNTGYPIIPGNVANASTYSYPVRFAVVEGADSPRLIGGDPTLLEPVLAAAHGLVRDGCRAIVGACGYFARFQRELAEALPVPVFLSSLCQVPMILGGLQPRQRLGILCAKASSLDQRMLTAVGVREDAPIVVAGMEHSPGFRGAILEDQGWMDLDQVRDEVVGAAVRLAADHPDIGGLLLECSDMPPYATQVQEATGLPVWDYLTLIDWIHSSVVRRGYDGFI
ncbi:aspartate/glutamate racemase family protein [Agromyces sp. ZXT2-3]|uniref:aspartate/glutamate racemase family protein n=1 Tax=Agromyces sp. ZXT2-3 TaxID=3461152 RepID=UPI004054CB88